MLRCAAAASVAAVLVWTPAASAGQVSTLVVTSRPISTFAFEGHTIGWATRPCTFGSGIARFHVQNIVTGRTVRFTSRGLGCGIVEAVTDRRVVNDGAQEAFADWLETATLNRRHLVQIESFFYRFPPGTNHGPVVSDGLTFVYSRWSFDFQNPTTCLQNGAGCDLVVTGGGLKRLSGPPPATVVPGAPPAKRISLSGGLVALQPYVIGSKFKTGNVQVRAVKTGSLVSSFATTGDVVGMALHGTTLAVMVGAPGGGKHVDFRSATSGALLSSFPVARAAGHKIDLSGRGLLFRVGGDLRLLDPTDGARRTLHSGHRKLIAWQIEGRRVVWVVDGPIRGFVMTRVLP